MAAGPFVLVAGRSATGKLIATVLRRALEELGAWALVTAAPVERGGVPLPAGAQLMLMGTVADPDGDRYDWSSGGGAESISCGAR